MAEPERGPGSGDGVGPDDNQQPQGPRIRLLIAVAVVVVLLLSVLMFPQVGSGPVAKRTICKNNLHQFGLALHNYHDAYGGFPPAYVADANGRPLYSWRVLILPFLEQSPLYREFRLNEAWDSPHNKKLSDQALPIFNCPEEYEDDTVVTNYVAIVGPHTAFPGANSVKLTDITDGSQNTILLVEVKDSGIHWAEPRDMHVLQMTRTVNAERGMGISSVHKEGAHVLLCDGSVRFIRDATPEETLQHLIEIDDGEEIGRLR